MIFLFFNRHHKGYNNVSMSNNVSFIVATRMRDEQSKVS